MPTRVCAHHRRVPAVSECVSCSEALCRDCIIPTGVGFKCASCTGSKPASTRGRRAATGRKRLLGATLTIVIVTSALLFRAGREQRTSGLSSTSAVTRLGVAFPGGDGLMLQGTLELPRTANGAGVVIVPGFGPTTRNGIVASDGTVADPIYRDVSRMLTSMGFTVLRYDKRGTETSPATESFDFQDLVADAAAAVELVAGRADIGRDRVAIVGHDEGGLVGIRVAAGNPDVAALVAVSTPGRPLVQVLVQEIRAGGFIDGRPAGNKLARELEIAVTKLIATGEVPPVSEPLRAVLPRNRPDYLEQIFSLDPVAEARSVEAAVLLVRGSEDPGILPTDVETLRRALHAAPKVDILEAHGAGHTLQVVDGPEGAMSHDGEPVHRDMRTLERLARWLDDVLGLR